MNRRDEAALRESEARYRTIFETAREGICQVDEQFNITLANQRMADMLGYTVEEIQGHSLFEFITDCQIRDIRQWGADQRQSLLEKFDCCLRRKDGSEIWAIISGKPMMSEDDRFSYGVVMITDITDIKRAEAALRASEWKYRTVADFTYDWEFWLAPDGNYLYVSPACERITGYTPDEFQASPHLMTEIIHPDDKEMAVQHLTRGMTIGVANPIEFRIIARDGTQRWIGHVCQPVYDPKGSLLGQRGSNRDITERKQTEAALQKSQKLLNETGKMAKVGGWEVDIETMELQWTEEVYHIHEVDLSFHPTVDNAIEFYTPDSKPVIAQAVQRAIEFGESFDSELEIITAKGNLRWVHAIGKANYTLNKITSISGTFQDITDSRQAEMNLRESEERFRTLTHLAPVGVYLTDPDGHCQYVNQCWLDMSGMTFEEALGDGWINGVHPDDRRLILTKWQQMVESQGAWGLEYRFQTPAGKITWVLGLATGLRNSLNEKIGYIGVNTDITERKHIEETLRQSEERYRTLVETMSEGFVVSNKEMTIAYVNDQFCRISGYEKEELIGKAFDYYFDEENRIIIREQFMKRKQRTSGTYEVEITRKDGSKGFAEISAKPVFDSENSFQGSLAVISDITLRKETDTMFLTEHQAMKTQFETTMTQIDNLNMEIQGYNHALKVLLKNAKEDQKIVEENIVSNVREMVAPFLERLKHTRLSETQKSLLDVVGNNLNNIISPFINRLKAQMRDFTPMEIQVANLVREGKTNIEIGDILAISEYTAMFHRKNIRKKLGLQHEKINLRTYLLSLST